MIDNILAFYLIKDLGFFFDYLWNVFVFNFTGNLLGILYIF